MGVQRATVAQLITSATLLEEQATVSEMDLEIVVGSLSASDEAFITALRSGAAFLRREIDRRNIR